MQTRQSRMVKEEIEKKDGGVLYVFEKLDVRKEDRKRKREDIESSANTEKEKKKKDKELIQIPAEDIESSTKKEKKRKKKDKDLTQIPVQIHASSTEGTESSTKKLKKKKKKEKKKKEFVGLPYQIHASGKPILILCDMNGTLLCRTASRARTVDGEDFMEPHCKNPGAKFRLLCIRPGSTGKNVRNN